MNTDAPPTTLVVEDERDLADLYTTWLSGAGYDVRVAYGGEGAIEELDETVDVVLLDRRMPGLSGDDVLETIVERGYTCRVAMVTAVEPDFDIIDMGFDDYLVKPVSRDDLIETVERITRRSAYDDRLDEYATLVTKKSTLEAEKTDSELETNPRFERLETRIEQLQSTVDGLAQEFDDDDVAAVLRDITVQSET